MQICVLSSCSPLSVHWVSYLCHELLSGQFIVCDHAYECVFRMCSSGPIYFNLRSALTAANKKGQLNASHSWKWGDSPLNKYCNVKFEHLLHWYQVLDVIERKKIQLLCCWQPCVCKHATTALTWVHKSEASALLQTLKILNLCERMSHNARRNIHVSFSRSQNTFWKCKLSFSCSVGHISCSFYKLQTLSRKNKRKISYL